MPRPNRPQPKRPPPKGPRPPKRKTKPEDQRFVICPASGLLHGPVGVEITRDGPKRWPTARCAVCKTRIFFGKRIARDVGLNRGAVTGFNAIILDDLEF